MVLCVASLAGPLLHPSGMWKELGIRTSVSLNRSLAVSIWEEIGGDPKVLSPAQIYCQNFHQVLEEPTVETYTRRDKHIGFSDLGN